MRKDADFPVTVAGVTVVPGETKAIIFDMMINLAEKEYQIDIRKNLPPEQLTTSAEKKKKL